MTDSILFWDSVACEANRVSDAGGQGEQTGSRLGAHALAIVHLAMYDAYVAIEKPAEFAPYLAGLPPAPLDASAPAAVAGAAHEALSALFPSQRSFFDRKLAEAGVPCVPGCPGQQFGRAIASALLEDYSGDANAEAAGAATSTARGRHRAETEPPHAMHGPLYTVRAKGLPRTALGRGGTRHARPQRGRIGGAPAVTVSPSAAPRAGVDAPRPLPVLERRKRAEVLLSARS